MTKNFLFRLLYIGKNKERKFMHAVNHLISRLEKSQPGSAINRMLRTGTYLEVTKESAKNTYRVVRKREQGDVYTSVVKKVNNKLITKSVVEEHRFGLVNILFRNDGSKVFNLRHCNVRGRASKQNNGFFKTSVEEYIMQKGDYLNSRNTALQHNLKKIRENERYYLPEKNYTMKDDIMYEEADAKIGLHD